MTTIDEHAEALRIFRIVEVVSPSKVRAALEWDKGVKDG